MTAEPTAAPSSTPSDAAETASPPAAPAPTPAPVQLWVERTGTRTYTGYSSRGAEVLIGPSTADGVFTPGELLKIALAGCSGMTADSALARRLGDDYEAVVKVAGPKNPVDDCYPSFTEELVVDLSSLDPTARERLLAVVHRAIAGHCTVARTLTNGATVELTVVGDR